MKQCGLVQFSCHVNFIKNYGPVSMSPGAETSMSNAVGKADRTGYHLKALQEIRNSLRPFATENGSPVPTIPKDGHISYQHQLYPFSNPSSGYIEVKMNCSDYHPVTLEIGKKSGVLTVVFLALQTA